MIIQAESIFAAVQNEATKRHNFLNATQLTSFLERTGAESLGFMWESKGGDVVEVFAGKTNGDFLIVVGFPNGKFSLVSSGVGKFTYAKDRFKRARVFTPERCEP